MRPTKKTKKDSAASLVKLMASTRAEARDITLETDEVLDPNDVPAPREPSCMIDAMLDSLYKHANGPFMYLQSNDQLYLVWN